MWDGYIISFLFALYMLYHIVKFIRDARHLTNHEIPLQLVQLVRQAHLKQPFKTMWDIQVSPEMQDALQLPLTPEYLRAVEQARDDRITRFVNCNLLSHRQRDKTLSGVVSVTIDIKSDSGIYDYHIENVKVRVTVRHAGDYADYQWVVDSVELAPEKKGRIFA